jgi:hypothetical protein
MRVLEHAAKELRSVFPALRKTLTESMLGARIEFLNTYTRKGRSDFIWILPHGWKLKEYSPKPLAEVVAAAAAKAMKETVAQPVPVAPITPVAPVIATVTSAGAPQSTSVRESIQFLLNLNETTSKTMSMLGKQQTELAVQQAAFMKQQATFAAQHDGFLKQQGEITTLLSLQLESMAETQEAVREMKDVFAALRKFLNESSPQSQPQTPVVTVVPVVPTVPKVTQQPVKKLPNPKPGDRFTCVRREDVCFGESWDRISKSTLTTSEKDWQRLYKDMTGKQKSETSIIVFGWYATVSDLQEIFYRLNPAKIFWIHVYNLGTHYQPALRLIDYENGQLGIVYPQIATTDNRCLEDGQKQFVLEKIPFYRLAKNSINTNAITTHWLMYDFKLAWVRFAGQPYNTTKVMNGHA